MAVAAILDFGNCEILLANWVQSIEMHHRAKFCHKQSIHYRDIAIFFIFYNGVCAPSLICFVHGPSTRSTQWSLPLCKIWLQSVQ